MQQHSYDWLKTSKDQLSTLMGRQVKLNRQLSFEHQNTDKLAELAGRLQTEDFKVMVMGMFSSGKSTFINALLGKQVLPVSVLPATAVICEIKYAAQVKCVLYPKMDRYKDKRSGKFVNDAFDIPVNELENYILIKNDGEENADTSPFEKMLLDWPLGICKNGVEIIDSPGLNDPNSHDKITLEYLPKTDAIIFCMSAAYAYSQKDKQTIEELLHMGYRSIIFILTNFDRVQEAGEEDNFKKAMLRELTKHTDLGVEGVLFVNSRGGVLGKEQGDAGKLQKSNIPLVEQKVELQLVCQRGKAKLIVCESQLKNQNEITLRYIDNKLLLNSLGLNELRKKHELLSSILEAAKSKRDIILTKLELCIADILSETNDIGRLFLGGLDNKIEKWVNDYTPEVRLSINPMNFKASIKAIVDEYVEHIKYKIKQESLLWGNETLYPMIRRNIEKVTGDIEAFQLAYEELITNYQVEMNLSDVGSDAGNNMRASDGSKLVSLLYVFVSGDIIGAGMGFAFGFKGLLSSLVAQIAVGVVIGIASLFTPVGLPVFIFGAIMAGLGAGAWNFNIIPRKIKEAVIENTRKAMLNMESQHEIIKKIRENLKHELVKLVESARELFDKDIRPKETEMKEALEIRKKDEQAINDEKKLLNDCRLECDAIGTDLENFKRILYL